jgi:phosphatidylinositol alpha-1,6-mannosyltransferase
LEFVPEKRGKSGMKKTLLVTLDFLPKKGGVATHLHNIAEFFGENVIVVTPSQDNDFGFDSAQNFKVFRKSLLYKFFWPRFLKAFFVIKEICKKEKAEILAVNDVLPLGYAALVLKCFFRIPYFVFLHGLDFNLAKINFWKRFWLKKILKNAKFVVCNSRHLENKVKGLDSKLETLVVYPTPKIPSFSAEGGSASGGEAMGGEGRFKKGKVIFSLGRLIQRKGFDKLIPAFSKIKEMIPDALLVIAGKGPKEEFLKKLASGNSSIIFVGEIGEKQKWAFYNLCDLFALPTREINGDIEGFGIVYLEAAAFGKPSVAGRVGGVSEAVLDGETGILVNGKSVDEIAEAIMKLLKDDILRKEMGERAKRIVLEEFKTDRQVSKITDLL